MEGQAEGRKTEIRYGAKISDLLRKFGEVELEDVDMEVEELEIALFAAVKAASPALVAPKSKMKPTGISKATFTPPNIEYPGQIVEVKLGATKGEGGTREKSIVIGGEKSQAFYLQVQSPLTHPPVVACDVFDMKIPLPKAIKTHVKDVMEDPAAWAKRCVDKFGAEMITLQLTSVDPKMKGTSPKEAARTVEEVLQAVGVPLAVGGCGDPVKDLAVFSEVAEVAEGERLLISSISPWMDTERAAEIVKEYGHVALALSGMDMNEARKLNRTLYDILPREQIVMDTSTASLGSGLEFTYTLMARIRLAALMGDYELQHPISSGTTNAWFARESWKEMAPQWEPRELRGPLWETVTALTGLLAGVDYFMMMHPKAIETVKFVIQRMTEKTPRIPEKIADWVSIRI